MSKELKPIKTAYNTHNRTILIRNNRCVRFIDLFDIESVYWFIRLVCINIEHFDLCGTSERKNNTHTHTHSMRGTCEMRIYSIGKCCAEKKEVAEEKRFLSLGSIVICAAVVHTAVDDNACALLHTTRQRQGICCHHRAIYHCASLHRNEQTEECTTNAKKKMK